MVRHYAGGGHGRLLYLRQTFNVRVRHDEAHWAALGILGNAPQVCSNADGRHPEPMELRLPRPHRGLPQPLLVSLTLQLLLTPELMLP